MSSSVMHGCGSISTLDESTMYCLRLFTTLHPQRLLMVFSIEVERFQYR